MKPQILTWFQPYMPPTQPLPNHVQVLAAVFLLPPHFQWQTHSLWRQKTLCPPARQHMAGLFFHICSEVWVRIRSSSAKFHPALWALASPFPQTLCTIKCCEQLCDCGRRKHDKRANLTCSIINHSFIPESQIYYLRIIGKDAAATYNQVLGDNEKIWKVYNNNYSEV